MVAILLPTCSRRRFAARTARSPSISRPPRSSSPSSCSARCWSCAREADLGRHPRAARSGAKTARRLKADGSDEEVSLDAIGRRSPPGPPREKVPGRRRGGRRPLGGRRVDGHRRAHAGDEEGGRRRVIGGTLNDRQASSCGPRRSARHHARADRPDGREGAALARADPAPGRPVSAWFVPVVILVAIAAFVVWALWGPSRGSPSPSCTRCRC